MQCPRCRLALFAGDAGGSIVHACGRCGGVFLDAATAVRVSQAAPPKLVDLADSAGRHAVAGVDLAAPAPCPVCAATMQRISLAGPGVEVDTCSKHGTWYDKSELQAVERSFRAQKAKRMAGAAAVGAVAVAGGVAAGVAMQQQAAAQQAQTAGVIEAVGNGIDVVEIAADVGGAVADAGVGEAIAEGAGAIFGFLGELLSGLGDLA